MLQVESSHINMHMWQSRVEIKHYSVAYFNHIYRVRNAVAQNFRYGQGSYVLHRLIGYSCIFTACISPALNKSFVLQHFKHDNAVELRNGRMFDFYQVSSRSLSILLHELEGLFCTL